MKDYLSTMVTAAAVLTLLGCSGSLERVNGESSLSANTLEHRVSAAAKEYGKMVVRIDSRRNYGSGIVFTKKGHEGYYIVTNAHVMRDSIVYGESFSVTIFSKNKNCRFDKGPGLYIRGYDFLSDLAVLHLKVPRSIRCLFGPVANFDIDRDPIPLKSGTFVVAIGSPHAFSETATFGVISAPKRTFTKEYDQRTSTGKDEKTGLFFDDYIGEFVQTDAAINPGNSGGLLADLNGNVVGINTLSVDPADNIAFAISWPYARSIVGGLIDDGYFWRGGGRFLYNVSVSDTGIMRPQSADEKKVGITSDIGVWVKSFPKAKIPRDSLICRVNRVRIRNLANWFSEAARIKRGSKARIFYLPRPDLSSDIDSQCEASPKIVSFQMDDFLLPGEFFANFMKSGNLQRVSFADDDGLCAGDKSGRPCGVRISGVAGGNEGPGFQNGDVIKRIRFGNKVIEVRDLGTLKVAFDLFLRDVRDRKLDLENVISKVQPCYVWQGMGLDVARIFEGITKSGDCVESEREALRALCKILAANKIGFDVYRRSKQGTKKIHASLSWDEERLGFWPGATVSGSGGC